jgi:phosphoserine phosphatase RsbU/P
LPSWWKGPSFQGLVTVENGEVLRVIFSQDDALLAFDAPVDAQLFGSLEKRTGIQFLSAGGRVERNGREVQIEVDDEKVQSRAESRQISGMPFVSILDATDWTTGKQEQEPLTFSFRPRQLVSQLSPGSLDMAEVLVKALTAVGAVFLVMYCFALLLGLLLARSVTRSVHALSRGTERLQRGDFSHRIQVRSRDQLGELAESFNMMARGVEDLLRQQAEKERLEEELRIARQIQMSLLPAEGAVSLPGLQIAALCLPAAEVGGDYYDLIPLSETRLGVLVADVSGKGTSAALYMAELKGLVLSLARIYSSPAALLTEANSILCGTLDSRSFITMTYAVVDSAARSMRYARAGHNPIVHLEAKTGRTRVLTPPGLGLGLDRGERFAEVLEEAEVPLTSGDTFLFFTDGLSEAMNQRSELFGERRLRDVVEQGDGLGSEELKQRILEEIRAFADGASQHDDMTMVILKVV